MRKIPIDGIIGARPNMMKMAPLARAVDNDDTFSLRLIHTGQHYDQKLSDVFFKELNFSLPSHNLSVGSGLHGAQTGRIIEAYENLLLSEKPPKGVIVVGDVNSTMACTLVAAKLQIPVAHIEAGLRSGDRTMPEELNRIVTDALANILLVSDPDGLINLAREGHPTSKIKFVGNIMMDSLYRELPQLEKLNIIDELNLTPKQYVYLTMHRPSNVDDKTTLQRLIDIFAEISREVPFIFSLHPRTRNRLEDFRISLPPEKIFHIIEPLGYHRNLRLIQCAMAVFTDSGGIQEETSVLDVPCLTLRDCTERPVTIELGTSKLVGNDVNLIREAWNIIRAGEWHKASPIPLWDGMTAPRILNHLKQAWA